MSYPDELTQPSASAATEDTALRQYQRRTKRATGVYALALLVVVALVALTVKLIYDHGELVHVSRQSAPSPEPVPTARTATSLSPKWRTTDRAAGGDPSSSGVVVTYSQHTVNGRDARTGQVRWFYSRSDRDLCAVQQQDASTIAIFRHDNNCDEVTGFVTATGEPKFYRTLMDNGPSSVSSAPNVVMTVTATNVHVFDNAGGLDRWNWSAPTGCRVGRSLAGSIGVLISYHCGTANHLGLHPLLDDKPLTWTVDTPTLMIPIAAGAMLAAADPRSGSFTRYTNDKGTAQRPVDLGAPAKVATTLAALPKSQATVEVTDQQQQLLEIVALNTPLGQAFGISPTGKITWTAPATGPATLVDAGSIVLAQGEDVVRYDFGASAGAGAAVRSRLTGQTVSSPFSAYPIGSGLLIASSNATAYYG